MGSINRVGYFFELHFGSKELTSGFGCRALLDPPIQMDRRRLPTIGEFLFSKQEHEFRGIFFLVHGARKEIHGRIRYPQRPRGLDSHAVLLIAPPFAKGDSVKHGNTLLSDMFMN
jgi:hypothetical protein